MITVPECEDCNKGAQLDDDYFRLMLTLKEDVYDVPVVKGELWPKVYRSLLRPEAKGLTRSLLEDMVSVDVYTPSGVYVETKGAFHPDAERLENVATRTTIGLYYRLKRKRPANCNNVRVWCEIRAQSLSKEECDRWSDFARIIAANCEVSGTVGDGIFSYKVAFAEDDEDACAMILTFYERVSFIGFVPSSATSTS